MTQYTQQEIRKLFDTLPPDLKEAVLSEGTADSIRDICKRNGVTQENIPQVADMVGKSLMGLLPPDELPSILMTDLNTDETTARRMAQEINRFILFPVKDSLAGFYKEIRFVPGGRIEKTSKTTESLEKRDAVTQAAGATEETDEELPGTEETAATEKSKRPVVVEKEKGAADTYREAVE